MASRSSSIPAGLPATARLRASLALVGAAALAVAVHGMTRQPPEAIDSRADALALLPPLALPDRTPVDHAPPNFQLVLKAPDRDELDDLLVRAGASTADSAKARDALLRRFGGLYAAGDDLQLTLSIGGGDGQRRIEMLAVLSDLGRAAIVRQGDEFFPLPTERATLRWTVRKGAYWDGRRAGLDGEEAALLAQKVAELAPQTSIHFVTGDRPGRFDDRAARYILYLVADGPEGKKEFLRVGDQWHDAHQASSAEGLMRPVAGRITSAFGWRRHPILGFTRPHNGIDFAANWGTPIRAAADGVIVGAGWRGGYGRQVRIAHRRGAITTYSHLSSVAVIPSARVRRGQVIGYAGASGLATGPHLHFEVLRHGRPIDPLNVDLGGVDDPIDRNSLIERLRVVRAARPA